MPVWNNDDINCVPIKSFKIALFTEMTDFNL